MEYYVVYNNQGDVISAYEKYNNSETFKYEPILKENQAIVKLEIPDEYAKLAPTDLLERLRVDVKTRLSNLK